MKCRKRCSDSKIDVEIPFLQQRVGTTLLLVAGQRPVIIDVLAPVPDPRGGQDVKALRSFGDKRLEQARQEIVKHRLAHARLNLHQRLYQKQQVFATRGQAKQQF